MDNVNVKFYMGHFLPRTSNVSCPDLQDKSANVPAEVYGSFTQPWGNITSDVHCIRLVKFAHLHCHETKCCSILTVRMMPDCLKTCVGVNPGTLARRTKHKKGKRTFQIHLEYIIRYRAFCLCYGNPWHYLWDHWKSSGYLLGHFGLDPDINRPSGGKC